MLFRKPKKLSKPGAPRTRHERELQVLREYPREQMRNHPRIVEIVGRCSSEDVFLYAETQLALGRYEGITFEAAGMAREDFK